MENNTKDITPFNDKYNRHGYWIRYHANNNIYFRGNFINDEYTGYWEICWENGIIDCKQYHII